MSCFGDFHCVYFEAAYSKTLPLYSTALFIIDIILWKIKLDFTVCCDRICVSF